jgi:hypothetical protein
LQAVFATPMPLSNFSPGARRLGADAARVALQTKIDIRWLSATRRESCTGEQFFFEPK